MTQAPAVLLLLLPPLLLLCAVRCVDPYEPEHNSQMLLYAAMNSGELALAEEYADASVRFPATYGPMNMADGEPLLFNVACAGRQVVQASTACIGVWRCSWYVASSRMCNHLFKAEWGAVAVDRTALLCDGSPLNTAAAMLPDWQGVSGSPSLSSRCGCSCISRPHA